MSEHLDRRIRNVTYHRPSAPVQASMAALRTDCMTLVSRLDALIPECREKSLAVTALEETAMWAMKALALTDPAGEVTSP